MGIDYSAGMIVGCHGEDLNWPEDCECEYEWAEDNGLERMSNHYDADYLNSYFGFLVKDVLVDDIDEWLKEVKKLAKEFEDLTGNKASLIGAQDIY